MPSACDRTNISALNHTSNFLSVIQVFLDEQEDPIIFTEEKQVRKWVILNQILTANVAKIRKGITRSGSKSQRSYQCESSLFLLHNTCLNKE